MDFRKKTSRQCLKQAKNYTKWYNEELWPNAEQEAQDALIEAGVEVNEVDKEVFKEAVQPVIDDYLSSATEDQKCIL